ncbi:MAG: 2TM domain-containing protein [Bacteroidota bacterium]
MDEQTRYDEAKKRVEAIRGFYWHVVGYLVINVVLVVTNLFTSREYLWFIWPLMGWGVGLLIHALSLFGGLWGKSWEERKIKEIIEKDKRTGTS